MSPSQNRSHTEAMGLAQAVALIVTMASYQIVSSLVKVALRDPRDEQRLIRILAFAAFSADRRLADLTADRVNDLESSTT